MSTAIFENMIDSNFGEKTSSKGALYTQKSDSSEFCDLVKGKTLQSKTEGSKSEPKMRAEHDYRAEARSIKQTSNSKEQVAEENNVATTTSIDQADTVQETIVTTLPVAERNLLLEEATLVAEHEEGTVQEEELDQFEEEIIPAIDLQNGCDDEVELLDSNDTTNNRVAEENVVVPVTASELARTVDSENVNTTSTSVVADEVVYAELPAEDQAMHHSLKTLDLPNGFTPDDLVEDVKLLSDRSQTMSQSEGIRTLKELNAKLETSVKVVVENESGKNVAENTKPIIVAPSLNLALADTTKHGRDVISRMQTSSSDQSVSPVSEVDVLTLDNEVMFSDLGGKDNSSSRQKSSSSLEAFSAVIGQTNDETFEITFKGHDFSSKRAEMPKPAMQVSLAVSEVLNSSSASGKKQITINLYPQALGAVKVEILSQVGHDGASKVESIKISADKHETLVMLEERKMELAKSLKEVNGTEEKEATLQFEMSQDQGKGQGAYFTSLEERNNWMSKFVGLVADDELHNRGNHHEVDEYATRGIVTEDKVDLVA